MNSTVRRHRLSGLRQEPAAACVRHTPARLLDEQRAGADVPRLELALPVAVERAARDQREIERRRAQPPDRAGGALEVLPLGEVVARRGRAVVREAGDEQRLLDLRDRADLQARGRAAVVEE